MQSRETIHIIDLDNEPMIVCQGGFVTPIIEIFKEFGTTLYAKYNGQKNTALSMIQEGLGISIVSRTSLSLYVNTAQCGYFGQLIRNLLERFT